MQINYTNSTIIAGARETEHFRIARAETEPMDRARMPEALQRQPGPGRMATHSSSRA